MQREAAYAFVDGVRDREMKQNLLIGGEKPLIEALNQALSLEAAWPPVRLREVMRTLKRHLHHPRAAGMKSRYAGGVENTVTSKGTAGRGRVRR
jgi:hypothetical protein